ncbi:hypothetical protein [Streptacidiphilus albus]|uniref:hypothetical protein n=1 Tax=Streptacidiphilus albus TaxID=105425 RepID=UPI00054BDBF2|nr:hypothetical protein [Streptacidiphilus albus]
MLGFFGLDEEGESVYRVLLGLGTASTSDIGTRLGLTEIQVARAVRGLAELGLASPVSAAPGHYAAAPPAIALNSALSERRYELRQAELAVETLTQEYRRDAARLALTDLVEVVTGAEAVRHRFDQVQLGAEKEMLALVTDAPIVVSGYENDSEPVAVARGVTYRVVMQRSALDAPGTGLLVSEALGRNEEIRVAEHVPTKLMMADRSVAMLPLRPLDSPGEPSALLVRAGGLLEAMSGLFELVWAHALPIRMIGAEQMRTEEGDQPDGTDLQILSLLLLGMTDVSVAKQLDLGLRTVQRRVKRLLDMAGVTTRMQLGWHAYERGWAARR